MNLTRGALGADDQTQNLRAVREGRQVFSAYDLRDGTRICIITEADRSVNDRPAARGVLTRHQLDRCGARRLGHHGIDVASAMATVLAAVLSVDLVIDSRIRFGHEGNVLANPAHAPGLPRPMAQRDHCDRRGEGGVREALGGAPDCSPGPGW
jgi:hypothetical protein